MVATIVQKEDPVLRKHAEAVDPKEITGPEIQRIINDMKETLEREPDGVGLAAPQIGIPLQIFIVSHRTFELENDDENAQTKPKASDLVYINPEIIRLSKKKQWVPEGCLSVRWLYGNTHRAEKATIRAYNEHGELVTRGAGGLLAHIFQHEVDHLNGILFIDHAKDIEEVHPDDLDAFYEGHEK